jgi:hypothetical protein
MAVSNEVDLYAPVKRLLEEQGYTVRAEVDRCDLVAVRGGEPPVIVELKPRFALSLLYQGIERQRIADAVYLAVAAPIGRKAWAIWNRKRGAVLQLCRRLGLGLITVDPLIPARRKSTCISIRHAMRRARVDFGPPRPAYLEYVR